MTPTGTRTRETGNGLVAVLILVVIAAGIAGAILLTSLAQHREAQADAANERAFRVAEAGIAWGLARLRESSGALPTNAVETSAGSCVASSPGPRSRGRCRCVRRWRDEGSQHAGRLPAAR